MSLAARLGVPASRQVMLRLVMAVPDPEASSTPQAEPVPRRRAFPGSAFSLPLANANRMPSRGSPEIDIPECVPGASSSWPL